MILLRPYQTDLYAKTQVAIRRVRRVCIQAPCRSGKGELINKMCQSAQAKRMFVQCWVHRKELLDQTFERMRDSGIDCGIIAAGHKIEPSRTVQVCSIGSLRSRITKIPTPSLIIADEFHHVVANTYTECLKQYPQAYVVGYTATPWRLSGQGLADYCDELIVGPQPAELIRDGYLCDYILFRGSAPDTSQLHVVAGEVNQKENDALFSSSTVIGDSVHEYKKHCMGKRAVVFAWSVKSSMDIAAQFREAGIGAVHVDAETDPTVRRQAVADFRAGRVPVFCNVDIVSEGFNLAEIEAVFLLRHTLSLTRYIQQVSRPLTPGKPFAMIFDHANLTITHGLPDKDREWTLVGKKRSRDGDKDIQIKQCPACYAWLSTYAKRCGKPLLTGGWCTYEWSVVAERQMEQVAGELQEVDVKAERLERLKIPLKDELRNAETLDQLREIAKARGYKQGRWEKGKWHIGWAEHVFQARMKKGRQA